MSLNRVRPRDEQVAELTRGQHLPLTALHQVHLEIIAERLTRVWNELLLERRSELAFGDEAEVTTLIETRLNHLLTNDPLWEQMVRVVAKGKETISFDGSSLEKRPDLSIYLTNRNPSFPLVVECKIIDISSHKQIELYCQKGLLRFIKGEYAWAVREAFMLAYVRDGSTISTCLSPFLSKCQSGESDTYHTTALPGPEDGEALARTNHAREFHYINQREEGPGPISIWHLWLAS